MFQISEHYLPYQVPTMIVTAGGERVRIFHAHGRIIEERESLELSVAHQDRERSDYTDGHNDEADQEARKTLYVQLSEVLSKNTFDQLILCAPEIYQYEVREALSPDQESRITQFVPKNLASLPVDAIIRILNEKPS